MPETVIIGGGLHGISTALGLAARGRRSVILEAGSGPLTRASIRNEGKIHLGFVYALDETGLTTRAMVEGSLAFAPLIERWCGPVDWPGIRSDQFGYVAMTQGLAEPDQLESHYEEVLAQMRAAAPGFGTNYLGVDTDEVAVIRHDQVFPGMAEGHSGCWFETPERAVNPLLLAGLVERAAEGEPKVSLLARHRVVGAARTGNGFRLEVETPSGRQTVETETVVNCAWEGRPTLDRMILEEPVAGNFRVKYQVVVRGEGTGQIKAATLVQGPFGDVVPWPGGEIFINWYPVARTHFGDQPLERLEPDSGVAARVHEAIRELFPAFGDSRVVRYAPCYILAEGHTDINDPGSRLHSRIGAEIVGRDGWWSLRSTKLTTAPLAGERCAAAITGIGTGH